MMAMRRLGIVVWAGLVGCALGAGGGEVRLAQEALGAGEVGGVLGERLRGNAALLGAFDVESAVGRLYLGKDAGSQETRARTWAKHALTAR